MPTALRFPLPRVRRPRRLALGLACLAALLPGLAGAAPSTATQAPDADATALRTSPHDNRAYRALTLDNGLTALLVSDPEADRAAASLNVGVGSAQDPADLAGLAHLLEHMLFLGTEAYPEADAYQGYLRRHGGNHNAFTAAQDTNYFFDIEPEALPGALDRFSQFFIAPLFNADRLESERNVVHSEYMARRRDAGRRQHDVLNQVLNPDHPSTGFSVGSRETLADRPAGEPTLRQRMIDFYQRYYDAQVMHLAVVGPQSLDTLEQLVRTRFTAIAPGDAQRPVIHTPLVDTERLPRYLEMQSLRDSHQVSFYFPIPDPSDAYRHKPADYLSHLLGHEGEGSLLAVLREAGLADGLSAGVTRGDERHALFAVNISLTPAGAERLDTLQATLFAAIDQLRESGLDDWRYAEQARLADQAFRFQQHGSPLQSAMRLAMNLARYPVADVLYAPYRWDGFDREAIAAYLAQLTPERLIRLYSGPEVSGEQTSPWFQAPWRDITAAAASDAAPLAGLALPEPNPFIAEDVSLLAVADPRPQRLADATGSALWHQADSTFSTPKVEWKLSLQHPAASADARHAALSHLLAAWLEDSLNERFYPARLAGHHLSAYAHARGLTLAFSGWRDRQARVIDATLTQLQQGAIRPESFARVANRLQREWRNAPQAPLYHQAHRTLSEALLRPAWSASALLEASQALEVADLRAYRDAFLAELRLEMLAVGNLDAAQARRLGEQIAARLAPRLPAAAIPPLQVLDARADLPALHPHTGRDESLVLRYLQGGDRRLDTQARLAVLGQLIDTPFYHRLRTESQLGYVVNAGYAPLLQDAPGLSLLVQSPETPSAAIDAHIDRFLTEFGETLANLDETTLATHRQAVHDALLTRDTSLGGRADRLWRALAYGDTDFDHRQRLAERVLTVTPEALRAAWDTLRHGPALSVTFDPGDTASDVSALTRTLTPLPAAE